MLYFSRKNIIFAPEMKKILGLDCPNQTITEPVGIP